MILVTAQFQHQVQCALPINSVVCNGVLVLKLLPCEEETLLLGRDSLLVLELHLNILDRVKGVNFEGYRSLG